MCSPPRAFVKDTQIIHLLPSHLQCALISPPTQGFSSVLWAVFYFCNQWSSTGRHFHAKTSTPLSTFSSCASSEGKPKPPWTSAWRMAVPSRWGYPIPSVSNWLACWPQTCEQSHALHWRPAQIRRVGWPTPTATAAIVLSHWLFGPDFL